MKTRQSTSSETRPTRRLSRTTGTSSRRLSSQNASASRTTRAKTRAPKPTAPVLAVPAAPFDLSSQLSLKPVRRARPAAHCVHDYAEFSAALKDKKVQITLGNNIVTPESIVIDYDVAINLNGHCIISEQNSPNARVLDIRRGEVTITGEGKIFAMGAGSTVIRLFGAISASMPRYTQLTIDEKIQLYAPEGNAIVISANLGVAYGVTVNFSGKIIAQNGICLSQAVRGRDAHQPKVNVKSGSLIVTDEELGTAIDASGIGSWNFGAAKIFGQNGLHVKFGEVNFEHTQIVSCQPAILIDGEDHAELTLTLDNGVYVSGAEHVIDGNAKSVSELQIENGDFCSSGVALNEELSEIATIKDGNFSNAVDEYLQQFTVPDFTEHQSHASTSSIEQAPAEPIVAPLATIAPVPTLPESVPTLPPDSTTPAEISAAEASTPAPDPAPKPSRSTKKRAAISKKDQEKAAAEREALLKNFAEALSSMQNLRAEDYSSGFEEFRIALMAAEDVLNDPSVNATEIRDAADELLSAFDRLEEYDELSLSDDELDQLFYHGAILQEFSDQSNDSAPQKAKKSLHKISKTARKHAKKADSAPLEQAAAEVISQPPKITPTPVAPKAPVLKNPVALPDVDSGPTGDESEVTRTIDDAPQPSAINTPASLPGLPLGVSSEVAMIPTVNVVPAISPAPAQEELPDTPIASLVSEAFDAPIVAPKPEESTTSIAAPQPSPSTPTSVPIRPRTPAPRRTYPSKSPQTQPISAQPRPASPSLASYLIDELSPVDQWMTGAAMIDESTPMPFQSQKSSRRVRKSPPFSNFVKSLSVGVQAGFEAFHKTRQSVKK